MTAYMVREGRVLSLRASEWLMLLGGAIVSAFIMLLF